MGGGGHCGQNGTLAFRPVPHREALGSGTATKAYVAVVHGRWCGEERQAKVLKTVQHAPARVAVVPEGEAGGKLCEQAGWVLRRGQPHPGGVVTARETPP